MGWSWEYVVYMGSDELWEILNWINPSKKPEPKQQPSGLRPPKTEKGEKLDKDSPIFKVKEQLAKKQF